MTDILDSKGYPTSSASTNGADLNKLMGTYNLVDVDQEKGTVVLADRQTEDSTPPSPIDRELVSSPPSAFATREYNPTLEGTQGINKYIEMKNDAMIRTSLRIMKTPVLAARWFIKPASQEDEDVYIADFIWRALTQYMTYTWQAFVLEALLMLDYGYMAFEPVYDIKTVDNQERIVWKKLAPLHPAEINEIVYDNEFEGITFGPENVFIPEDKLLTFTFDGEAGNIEGKSILRSAYKHWYFRENLYKIDAIQKERHGVGVPCIKLPPGFDKDKDVKLAKQIGENLRSNEQAHVVTPPGWEIYFAELHGRQVDSLESADHHGRMIYENVLGSFMTTSSDRTGGEIKQQEEMFIRATRFVADIIRDVINKYAIPRLVQWNFGTDKYPELHVRRLGDTTDWRTISFAMRNFSGMGALIPDERLEQWVREELDLPDREHETARKVSSPQQAVTQPKQSTAPAQDTSKGPEGADGSGGK